jgi:hypothetical protein
VQHGEKGSGQLQHAGAAPANNVSSVYRPQECQRLRLTSLAPHVGQIQSGRNAGELSGGSIESRPCG